MYHYFFSKQRTIQFKNKVYFNKTISIFTKHVSIPNTFLLNAIKQCILLNDSNLIIIIIGLKQNKHLKILFKLNTNYIQNGLIL